MNSSAETASDPSAEVYYVWEPSCAIEDDMPRGASPFMALFVVVFTIGVLTISHAPGWNYVVKGMGVVLVLGLAIRSITARMHLAPESLLFFLWVGWSTLGLLANPNQVLFWESYKTSAQMALLLFVVASVAGSRKNVTINIFGFLVGAGIVGLYSVYTGEYQRAEETGQRVEGLVGGANGFAWYMLLCSICLAYMWLQTSWRMKVRRVIIITYMLLAAVAVVLSGSRKAFLALGLFYALWIWFCYRKHILRRPSVLIGVIVAILVASVFFVKVVEGSKLESRLGKTWSLLTGGSSAGGGGIRIELMKSGLDAFAESPIVGIGLNNVRLRNPGLMSSHCEYTELLGNTGLPGFLIYVSIYIVLWRRTVKLAKYAHDPAAVDLANLIRAAIIVVMLLSFGRWNYRDKAAWIVLGTFIGYSSVLWKYVKQRRDAAPVYTCSASSS